jgi:hypothetical protein
MRLATQPAAAAARRIAPTSRTVTAVCSTREGYRGADQARQL